MRKIACLGNAGMECDEVGVLRDVLTSKRRLIIWCVSIAEPQTPTTIRLSMLNVPVFLQVLYSNRDVSLFQKSNTVFGTAGVP